MSSINKGTPTNLQEASILIYDLCKLIEACYATMDAVDTKIKEGDIEGAKTIIEKFFTDSEELVRTQVH